MKLFILGALFALAALWVILCLPREVYFEQAHGKAFFQVNSWTVTVQS